MTNQNDPSDKELAEFAAGVLGAKVSKNMGVMKLNIGCGLSLTIDDKTLFYDTVVSAIAVILGMRAADEEGIRWTLSNSSKGIDEICAYVNDEFAANKNEFRAFWLAFYEAEKGTK